MAANEHTDSTQSRVQNQAAAAVFFSTATTTTAVTLLVLRFQTRQNTHLKEATENYLTSKDSFRIILKEKKRSPTPQ